MDRTPKRWHVAVMALVVALVAHFVPSVALAAVAFGAAGTTTTLTDADAALKIIADGTLIRNVVTDSELMDLFTQDSNVEVDKTTGGRYIERAQMFRLGGGYGFRGDNEYIPDPSAGVVVNSRIYLKKSLGVVEMTGDTMRRVQGDRGAYANWAEQELPNLVERVVNTDDRVMIGFGAGALARVTSVAGSPTLTIEDAHGINGYSNPWLNFLEGDKIVFSSTLAATALRGSAGAYSATVLSINQAAGSITIDALPTGTVAQDYIFQGDNAGNSAATAAGVSREFMGLLGLVDDGTILTTFQGITRSSYQQWQSVVIDGSAEFNGTGSGGQLNEDVIQYSYDETGVRGGGKPSVLVASLSGQRSFWKALRTQRYFTNPATSGTYAGGGFKRDGKGVPMLVGDQTLIVRSARKMPPQICFGLSPETFTRHMLDEFDWDQTTGAIWRQVTDATGRKDAFYAYGRKWQENSCRAPRKSFVIKGLTPVT